MTALTIFLVIVCGFALLFATLAPSSKKKKRVRKTPQKRIPAKKPAVPAPPVPQKKKMGPENPMWTKVYVEEITKRDPEMTTEVIRKWLRER
ncbi:hypothetical protein UR09_06520 [Candidatus Nitromaritima sp. SCGC AAA799-A02]|nr:hypothetical protein UR09_06520 [Candidatus Nitromaritima sp. SCGC AAA799-A02]